MSEIDVLTHLAYRGEMDWNLVQWWIGISFGLMIGSFVGSEHLTKGLTALSIFLYFIYSAASLQEIFNQAGYIQATYETLELLAASSGLTPIGHVALENGRSNSISLMPVLCLMGFLATVGFVMYSYKEQPNTKS
jgi:hypothetical protein